MSVPDIPNLGGDDASTDAHARAEVARLDKNKKRLLIRTIMTWHRMADSGVSFL